VESRKKRAIAHQLKPGLAVFTSRKRSRSVENEGSNTAQQSSSAAHPGGGSAPLARSIKTTMPGMKTKLTNVEVSSWPEQPPGRHSAQGQPGQFVSSSEAWLKRGQRFQRQVCMVWMILKDPRTPWYVRVVAAGTVGYLFSPVQLIPSFIPVIGFLDDFAALWLGFRFIQRFAPEAVVRDCNEQAAKMPPISARELKRMTRIAAVAFVLIGLSGAVCAAWWLFR